MQIDREIEVFRSQTPSEAEIDADPLEAARDRGDDDFVEMRIVANDGCGRLLDHIGETRAGVRSPQRANQRRGEDDVPDETQAKQQNRAWRGR